VDNANGTATLSWNDSNSTTTGYDIQRRKLNTRKGTWGNWSIIANTDVTTYTDASGKGVFGYQIRAVNATETSDWSVAQEITVTSVSTKGGGGSKGGRKTK